MVKCLFYLIPINPAITFEKMKYSFTIFIFCFFSFNVTAQYAWMNNYFIGLDNYVTSVDTTSDQGYFIAGFYQYTGLGNYFAAKLDNDGNEIWYIQGDKFHSGSYSNSASCILNTGDGGCLVAGTLQNTDNDLYFIRLDSTGQVVWEKSYGGINNQYPKSIIKDGNNYLCSFRSFPNPSFNALLKLNDQGDSLWSKNLTISPSAHPSSMIRSVNGNIIICGTARNLLDSNLFDLAYCELDTSGELLNIKRFPNTLTFGAQTINQANDGGFLLSSYDYFNGISKIIKADSTGIIQWVKEFNNANYCSATILKNNDIAVSLGSDDYSIYILQFDMQGNLKMSDTISIGFLQAVVRDNITDRNGSMILCGQMYNSNSCQSCSSDGFVLKMNFDSTNSINDLYLKDLSNIKIYPNPLNPAFSDLTIESKGQINRITIIDLTGNIIFQSDKNSSTFNSRFQLHFRSQLSAGTYFILFENNSGYRDSKKLFVFD